MKIKCSFCDKPGHLDSACFHKKLIEKNGQSNLKTERSFLNRLERFQKAEKAKKICSFCNKSGHNVTECYHKKRSLRKTNPEVPNITWVPKIMFLASAGLLSRCTNKAMVFGQWMFKTHDRR